MASAKEPEQLPAGVPAGAVKRKFIVSAYYSPERGQKSYSEGTYAAEIRMNGNGTHGASGKPVHAGMIAAPKTYEFGTQIRIVGVGDFTVEDRGGAIVKAGVRGHEHDRLDIWMGKGQKGLDAARAWGVRTVDAYVYP